MRSSLTKSSCTNSVNQLYLQNGNYDCSNELNESNPQSLEEYVQGSLSNTLEEFVHNMITKMKEEKVDQMGDTKIEEAIKDAVKKFLSQSKPELNHKEPKFQLKNFLYQFRFNHKCRASGCGEPRCDLCETNPKRKCKSAFQSKYIRGDVLKSICSAPIYVEMFNRETGDIVDNRNLPCKIEFCILDGRKFDDSFLQIRSEDDLTKINNCILYANKQGKPLLSTENSNITRNDGKIIIDHNELKAYLPNLSVQSSSEALLSGRRPCFRLLVRVYEMTSSGDSSSNSSGVVNVAQHQPFICPAASGPFTVVSNRSRSTQKKPKPFIDDPIKLIENIGNERNRKLCDLKAAARECHVDMVLPLTVKKHISTVGDLKAVVHHADSDGNFKQKLLTILKMSEKAWMETREHVLLSMTNDTRMRAWYKNENSRANGLLFKCSAGEIELEKPMALIENCHIIMRDKLRPSERIMMKEMQDEALGSWFVETHPGWVLCSFTYDELTSNPNGFNNTGTNIINQSLIDSKPSNATYPCTNMDFLYGNNPKRNIRKREVLSPLENDHKKIRLNCDMQEDYASRESLLDTQNNSNEYLVILDKPPNVTTNTNTTDTNLPPYNNTYHHQDNDTSQINSSNGIMKPIVPRPPPESGFSTRAKYINNPNQNQLDSKGFYDALNLTELSKHFLITSEGVTEPPVVTMSLNTSEYMDHSFPMCASHSSSFEALGPEKVINCYNSDGVHEMPLNQNLLNNVQINGNGFIGNLNYYLNNNNMRNMQNNNESMMMSNESMYNRNLSLSLESLSSICKNALKEEDLQRKIIQSSSFDMTYTNNLKNGDSIVLRNNHYQNNNSNIIQQQQQQQQNITNINHHQNNNNIDQSNIVQSSINQSNIIQSNINTINQSNKLLDSIHNKKQ